MQEQDPFGDLHAAWRFSVIMSFKCTRCVGRCQNSPACTFYNSRTMKMIGMENRWNGSDRRKPKYLAKNLSQCHLKK